MVNRMLHLDDCTSGRATPTPFIDLSVAGLVSIDVYSEVCDFQLSEALIERAIVELSE